MLLPLIPVALLSDVQTGAWRAPLVCDRVAGPTRLRKRPLAAL
jgi:hypothetical protein